LKWSEKSFKKGGAVRKGPSKNLKARRGRYKRKKKKRKKNWKP